MNAHASHFRSVSLRLHRGRRNPQRRPAPLFCRHRRADRAPKHSADAWRMIQLGAADIGSRVPADPRAPPPTAQANICPISAPRVDSSQSPRRDDNAREPIATRTTALPILTQIKSLQSNRPYEFQFGGTSPRKTCSAHQSEAHHEKNQRSPPNVQKLLVRNKQT